MGYDGLGQPESTTVDARGAIPQETVVMGYRLSGVAQTMGIKQGDAGSMSEVMPLVTEVSYSGTGQLTSRKYANGLERQYGWDTKTRALTAVVARFPDLTSPLDANGKHQYVTVQHDEFTRDVMGRITQSTNEVPVAVDADGAGGNPAVSQVTAECFTYDGFNRLAAAWTVADASSLVCGGQAPASVGSAGWDASGTAYQAQWVYTLCCAPGFLEAREDPLLVRSGGGV
ncbi:MAG: hypothetical protein HGA51_00495 [Demequinaceae bacterium]|nr:hypothetical protein [Demequinaceae bacterium]